jgi:hypothetical protein
MPAATYYQQDVDCSKLAIAKRTIFDVLDDNRAAFLQKRTDSLGIRIGYMRFVECMEEDSSVNYTSGCNTLQRFDFDMMVCGKD